MAEEEEDDESFGDFTFASFPNQPLPSTSNSNSKSNHTISVDDDDWGDFVNHSNQINGGFSKPFHPFGDPTEKHVNGIAVKPQGAIPLSIFGEEEEEKEEKGKKMEEPAPAFVFSNGDALKRGSATNGSIGISDLISNLYNQRPQMSSDNGSNSISKDAAHNSNADERMNSNGSNLNSDVDDEDGWEFKSAEWETGIKTQNVKVKNRIFNLEADENAGINTVFITCMLDLVSLTSRMLMDLVSVAF